jgi:hypothetical protein
MGPSGPHTSSPCEGLVAFGHLNCIDDYQEEEKNQIFFLFLFSLLFFFMLSLTSPHLTSPS